MKALNSMALSNQTSMTWTTAGDGTFNNASIVNAVYTPGTQDIANGGTTLTLTAYQNTEVLSDDLEISFVEEPTATGVDNIFSINHEPIAVAVEIENIGNFNGWTTTGTGMFDNPYDLSTTYTPSAADYQTVDIVLTANYSGCGYKTYQFEVAVHLSPDAVVTPDASTLSIHPNPTNDIINISIDKITSDVQVVIYNNIGQVVYNQRETIENGMNTTINLSGLATGTYILQVRSDEDVWTKKVIKR